MASSDDEKQMKTYGASPDTVSPGLRSKHHADNLGNTFVLHQSRGGCKPERRSPRSDHQASFTMLPDRGSRRLVHCCDFPRSQYQSPSAGHMSRSHDCPEKPRAGLIWVDSTTQTCSKLPECRLGTRLERLGPNDQAMIASKLICIDGIPGAGKSTTSQRLCLHLLKLGYEARWCYEHGPDSPIWRGAERYQFLESGIANPKVVHELVVSRWKRLGAELEASDAVVVLESSLLHTTISIMLAMEIDESAILNCL